MRGFFLFFFLAFVSGIFASETSVIVSSGQSSYSIYCAEDAIAPEKFAASELQKYLEKTTGAKVPISGQVPASGKFFAVGVSATVRELCPDIKWDALAPDEIVLRKKGGAIVLAGERPRGSIYAVYEFIEKQLGVRFWSHTVEKVPRLNEVSVGKLDYRYHPPFRMREAFCIETNRIPAFAVKMRNNGHWNVGLPDDMGGHYVYYPNFAHTFDKILPYDKYIKTNPEFYTKLGDKHYKAQFCMSNPEMRKEFIKNVFQHLEEHPEVKLLQLSQLDGIREQHSCTCERCVKMRRELGGSSDMLIHFLNEVTEAVIARYPDLKIETFAYNFTRPAPKTVKPHKDLQIRFCVANDNALRPINHPDNKACNKDYSDWKNYGCAMGLWLYKADFLHSQCMLPNFDAYNEIRYYAENPNLFAVFIQCLQSSYAEFSELRTYLGSKLLWDPSLEVWDIIREFNDGFYGSAGKTVTDYLLYIQQVVDRTAGKWVNNSSESFVTVDELWHAYKMLDRAVRDTAADQAVQKRVRRVRMTVLMSLLQRKELGWQDCSAVAENHRKTIDVKAKFDELQAECAALGIQFAGEYIPVERELNAIRDNLFMPPAREPLPDTAYAPAASYEILPAAWRLRFGTKIVDNAAYFKLDSHKWPITLTLPSMKGNKAQYDVWVSARGRANNPSALVFGCALFDIPTQKFISGKVDKRIKAAELSPEEYRFFHIGTYIPDERERWVVLTSHQSGADSEVWFDRIVLTRKK